MPHVRNAPGKVRARSPGRREHRRCAKRRHIKKVAGYPPQKKRGHVDCLCWSAFERDRKKGHPQRQTRVLGFERASFQDDASCFQDPWQRKLEASAVFLSERLVFLGVWFTNFKGRSRPVFWGSLFLRQAHMVHMVSQQIYEHFSACLVLWAKQIGSVASFWLPFSHQNFDLLK